MAIYTQILWKVPLISVNSKCAEHCSIQHEKSARSHSANFTQIPTIWSDRSSRYKYTIKPTDSLVQTFSRLPTKHKTSSITRILLMYCLNRLWVPTTLVSFPYNEKWFSEKLMHVEMYYTIPSFFFNAGNL